MSQRNSEPFGGVSFCPSAHILYAVVPLILAPCGSLPQLTVMEPVLLAFRPSHSPLAAIARSLEFLHLSVCQQRAHARRPAFHKDILLLPTTIGFLS
jgi:hypothetical protein